MIVQEETQSERHIEDVEVGQEEDNKEENDAHEEGKWNRIVASAMAYAAVMGPGHSVAVGYIDPGNWATDIAAGSEFGYSHLFIILVSNIIAVFIQILALRLGVVAKLDLAEACRERFQNRPWVVRTLFIFAEIGIIAMDMAEVIGSAIALNLLLGIPLIAGVIITAGDVLLIIMGFERAGNLIELLIILLVMSIFGCFVYLISVSPTDPAELFRGYLPSGVLFTNTNALLIAIGIIGATVMPHNLYLHSSMVKDHGKHYSVPRMLRLSSIDVVISLSLAFFINSSILIIASADFHSSGLFDVAELSDAYYLLQRLMGPGVATVFAVSLLLSGQSSTITGTLAGQVVAEGFMKWKIKPWVRRLVTRLLAILPSIVVLAITGSSGLNNLLILSQVILSMQLPFAFFPLVYFTSDSTLMGEYANGTIVKIIGYSIGALLACLNTFLIVQAIIDAASG